MGRQFVPQALEVDAENLLWPEYLADNPDNYGIFNPSHCHYKQASSGHKLKKGKMTTFGMVCLCLALPSFIVCDRLTSEVRLQLLFEPVFNLRVYIML